MNDKIKITNEILNSKTINNINILTNNLKNNKLEDQYYNIIETMINTINKLTNYIKNIHINSNNKYNMLLKEHSNLQNKFYEERKLSIYYEMEYKRIKIYNDKLFTEHKELKQFLKDTLKNIEEVRDQIDNKKNINVNIYN